MSEDDLKVFVKGAERFFMQAASTPAEVSTPFVKEDADHVVYDFSAVIGITGTQRGCVYYTAPRAMVRALKEVLARRSEISQAYAQLRLGLGPGGAAVRVAYAAVTSDTRIDAVTSGKIDLECGSTTDNVEREKTVAFSPLIRKRSAWPARRSRDRCRGRGRVDSADRGHSRDTQ